MDFEFASLFETTTSSDSSTFSNSNLSNSLFLSEIDSETLIDSFRRIEVKIAPFKVVSKEKYNLFIKTLIDLKRKYQSDEIEYEEALKTNKLTLVCKPDFNMHLRMDTLLLEKAVNEYDIEYAYLITIKRLKELITKLQVLYIQIIKKKRQIELYKLVDKAKQKLSEICNESNTQKLSQNMSFRREEIVSLTHQASYMISKCYVRLEFPNVKLLQYFDLYDETEYLKYIIKDLRSLEEVLLRSYFAHPNLSKIKDKLNYLINFGFMRQKDVMLDLSFFETMFYIEDKLIPEISEEVKEAFNYIDLDLNISDDEKYFLKLFLLYFKNKLEISDICKLILLFDKSITLSNNTNSSQTFNKIESCIKNIDFKVSSKVLSGKFKFAISIELEDEKRCIRALKRAGIAYRIKDSDDGKSKDIYLPQEYVEYITLT